MQKTQAILKPLENTITQNLHGDKVSDSTAGHHPKLNAVPRMSDEAGPSIKGSAFDRTSNSKSKGNPFAVDSNQSPSRVSLKSKKNA